MSAIDPASVQVGTVLRWWHDTILSNTRPETTIIMGVVVERGPKVFASIWPNGNVLRVRYEAPKGIEVTTDPDLLGDPQTARVQALAKKWIATKRDATETKRALRSLLK